MANVVGALGGFAGGVAQGMNMGMQWKNQQQYLDQNQQRLDQQKLGDDRDAELHGMNMDKAKSEKDLRDRRTKTFQDIAAYTQALSGGSEQPGAAPQPQMQQQPGLGAPQMQAPQPGGLAQAPQMQQAQQPEQPAMPPEKVLERGMVTGAYSPQALTDIAGIYAKNGLYEEGVKYLEQAHKAKQTGMVDAAMSLARNDPGGAVEALKKNGIEIDGLPVKVNPKDPEDHNWTFKLKGDGEKEQTVNATSWLKSTMSPTEFVKTEDDKRKAALEERKQSNDDRKTSAEIGFLNSRSSLAQSKADGSDSSSLRSSRSSEAQINTAMTRRDKTFDRKSMSRNEDGALEVDPEKRQVYESEANKYQSWLEDKLGEEMDARQQHKFTDVMATFPVNGTPEKIAEWERGQLLPAFGGRQPAAKQTQQPAASRTESNEQAGSLAAKVPSKKPAPISRVERDKKLGALGQQMTGIQQALKSPGLDTNQKKVLSLKAQEIAKQRDALR